MTILSSRVRVFAMLALALVLANGMAWGQATTSLRGTVTDKTGASVAEAAVTLTNIDTSTTRTATTGSTGEYEFLQLPPGKYRLAVEKQGFRRYEHIGLQLLVGTPVTVNVTLQIGMLTETVLVTAEASALNTTDASLGNAFNQAQIGQLPLEGLIVSELLSLQPGVTYTGNRSDVNRDVDTRSGAVNGAHSDQSNITLDGVDVNDQTHGYAFTSVLPVTPDSLQEFRVVTSNYNADQGRSSGGQVALVTKSGSNDFHGSLFEANRNTLTSANDYFIKQSELASGSPNVAPKLIRNVFGGSVGGPFWKDRLFFFANYEGFRQREEASVVRIVPSATLRMGEILYKDVNGGITTLTPTDLKNMDPQGIGPSPVMLNYFQSFFAPFTPNDNSVGDGLNFVGFRFRGAVPTNHNWYIARVDYKITHDGSHSIFWRGALRNDTHSDPPYLPGQPAETAQADYSKGFVAAYSATLRPNLINVFRWGFTRQSFTSSGNSAQPVIFFRNLNDNETSNNSSLAITRTRSFQVPVHNFVDDVSWTRGKHTIQFGTNVAFIRNPRNSLASSFSFGTTNASWLTNAGIANTGTFMDPAVSGFPAVDSTFNNSYDYPLIALLGAVTQVNANYNYNRDGTTFPQGAPLARRFAQDSYEFYVQDTWKFKPNLTVTLGLRYSMFSPPWETNGLEVTPTMNLGDWFNLRGQHMLQGLGSFADPPVSFDLAGPANGKPGWYNWDYHNFGPRIAVAWSPEGGGGLLKSILGGPGKTSIRAGFGIVYDRIGQGLLSTFDLRGSFGMSTTLTNVAAFESLKSAPRLTCLVGQSCIPQTDVNGVQLFTPAPQGKFPTTFPNENQGGGFAATWGMDSSIKTPYSYMIDFSVARELPHGFAVDAAYVGRLSHRLLAQEDLAQPLDLVDPKNPIPGMDYFTAAQALTRVYRTGVLTQNFSPSLITVPPGFSGTPQAFQNAVVAYWTHMLQAPVPGGAYTISSCTGAAGAVGTTDPLRAAYDLLCAFNFGGETTSIQTLDQKGIPDFNGAGGPYFGNCGTVTDPTINNCFLNPQYASLYSWRSVGTASYHALQLNVRKRMSQGVLFNFNYTYSRSIDLESDAERVDLLGAGSLGLIINAWRPNQLRGVSDFDTPHQFNANWVIELPFGRGKPIGKDANRGLDAVIGGWTLSGLARWTSGFPATVGNGANWPTNWNLSGNAFQTGPVVTGTTKANGGVTVFPDPTAATAIGAFRRIFPGESGSRNAFRGDGFAGLDLGLAKRWKMPWKESHSLQLRWEVFNVLNLTRFDVQTATLGIDSGRFGSYTGLLTNPRTMQFALRYEF